MKWAWDLDGTLFELSDGQVISGGLPRDRAVAGCRMLARKWGIEPVYVTGRPPEHRARTLEELAAEELPIGVLHTYPLDYDELGHAGLEHWKAEVFRAHGVACAIGDLVHDERAALLAGVEFVHVDELERADLAELVAYVSQAEYLGYTRQEVGPR